MYLYIYTYIYIYRCFHALMSAATHKDSRDPNPVMTLCFQGQKIFRKRRGRLLPFPQLLWRGSSFHAFMSAIERFGTHQDTNSRPESGHECSIFKVKKRLRYSLLSRQRCHFVSLSLCREIVWRLVWHRAIVPPPRARFFC